MSTTRSLSHYYACNLPTHHLKRCQKPSLVANNYVTLLGGFSCLPRKLRVEFNGGQLRYSAIVCASSDDGGSSVATSSTRWLLQPIGDGDSRHIGFKTAMPGAIEIASNTVTVGRVPDKADVVIPVPTVSAMHARIRKTEENLVITDLDSTNGTFIDERRLTPGVPYAALPGNKITFGDTHLAIFMLSKLENAEDFPEAKETEVASEEVKEISNTT
ncbi:RNA splicing factor [Lithospermum erythrorhizon]|uniref:RNA splicing factor n=1 Tax=Lithospermum erythrorhizon TaxID=34254 RepID=A0AAV3RR78_LITER